ncbi:MAG: hypothetical protein IKU37_04090 [Candidatus Gastranaerophilales bacterium]|nr:hypothetical protein [Candidatus Gastranaerophilales bacterium]
MRLRINPKILLFAGLASTVPMKICKKQSVKFADCIVDTVSFAQKPAKNILVIDNFRSDNIDINGDFLCDVSHGFVTSSMIEKNLPDAKVVKCHIFPEKGINQDFVVNRFDSLLTSVLECIEKGKKFDAINLSLGFSAKYNVLSKKLGFNITPENIAENAQKVRNVMEKADNQLKVQCFSVKKVVGILEKMDKITSKGTKIYIAAGNSSDRCFNLLTLADNIVSVGGVDKKGNFVVYSDRNTLVNRFENGEVISKSVDSGFDFTGDGIADVKKEETSAFFNFATVFARFEGTSFATPRALVKDLLKNNE